MQNMLKEIFHNSISQMYGYPTFMRETQVFK